MMASIPVAAFSLFPKIDCASDDMAYTIRIELYHFFFCTILVIISWNQFCSP